MCKEDIQRDLVSYKWFEFKYIPCIFDHHGCIELCFHFLFVICVKHGSSLIGQVKTCYCSCWRFVQNAMCLDHAMVVWNIVGTSSCLELVNIIILWMTFIWNVKNIMRSHVTHHTTLYLVMWRQFDSQECRISTLIGMNRVDIWIRSSVVLLIELEWIKGKSKMDQQWKIRTNTR